MDLWGSVAEGAAVGLSGCEDSSGPPKVTEFHQAVGYDDVLWFDISVGNSFAVQVLHRPADLPQKEGCLLFLEIILLPDVIEEGPTLQVLQHQVDVLRITEHSVELDDVGVAEEGVDLDLLDDLGLHLVFLDPFLA